MKTPKFPGHRDDDAASGITLDQLLGDESLGRVRRFAKGAYVWQADDVADRIYFLREGRVVLTTAMPHERPIVLLTIAPEQPFGELCLCAAPTDLRGTTAYALVDSEAVEIKLSTFLPYLHQNRAALDALMVTVCLRLKDAYHRIEVMAHRGAEQRLGRLLVRLATSRERQGRIGRRGRVSVSVSHNELAQLGGMSRPHVTVTMGRLRARGFVDTEREGVVRVDVASLTDYLARVPRTGGRKRASASAGDQPNRVAKRTD
jgi:CRP-like cAMP-binding protein